MGRHDGCACVYAAFPISRSKQNLELGIQGGNEEEEVGDGHEGAVYL
jgi:hypothetical protein